MKAVIKKWGNSAAVRLPASIMKAAHLELEQVLDVREENGCVVIEPVHEETVSLDSLVAGITAENIHNEIDFGTPMGQEVDL